MILLGRPFPDPLLHVDAGTQDHRHLAGDGLLRTAVHDRTHLAHGRYLRPAHGRTLLAAVGLLRIADHDRTHRGPHHLPDDDDVRLPHVEAGHLPHVEAALPLLAAHLSAVVLARPPLPRLSNPTVLSSPNSLGTSQRAISRKSSRSMAPLLKWISQRTGSVGLLQNTGRAFVEFETVEDAEKAICHMDGGQLDGQVVDVAVATPRPRRPPPRAGGRFRSPFRRGFGGRGRGGGRDSYVGGGRRYGRSRSRSLSPPPRYRGRRYSRSPMSRSPSRRRNYSPSPRR
ncbi:hypothetical protein [Absidia glauca]|uniref:RRM domain-containing protein n=1 Tax=Absidia glauca TaxID=4829 RepID=A0A163JB58_ABSGL|nr:hypothetical protein [Absidia glauca]